VNSICLRKISIKNKKEIAINKTTWGIRGTKSSPKIRKKITPIQPKAITK